MRAKPSETYLGIGTLMADASFWDVPQGWGTAWNKCMDSCETALKEGSSAPEGCKMGLRA